MSILLDIYDFVTGYRRERHKSREEILTEMATDYKAATGEDLDWRNSVVDRMKLLKIDEANTTFGDRRDIAAYYGINGYRGTPEQNSQLMDSITRDMLGD